MPGGYPWVLEKGWMCSVVVTELCIYKTKNCKELIAHKSTSKTCEM